MSKNTIRHHSPTPYEELAWQNQRMVALLNKILAEHEPFEAEESCKCERCRKIRSVLGE